MKSLLDKIKQTLEEGYDYLHDSATIVIDKAEDFGKISKLKFEVKQLSANTEKKLTILGDAIYPYLLKNNVDGDKLAVACAQLGSDKPFIKVDKLKNVEKIEVNKHPQCLIIPGKLHFVEEEALKLYS